MDFIYNQENTQPTYIDKANANINLSNARYMEWLRRYFYYGRFYNYVNYRPGGQNEIDPMLVELIDEWYKTDIENTINTFNKVDLDRSTSDFENEDNFITFNDFEMNNL